MLPFLIQEGELPFHNMDYLFIPGIRDAVEKKAEEIRAYVVGLERQPSQDALPGEGQSLGLREFTLRLGDLTDEERQIIQKGCLINYNRL